MTAPPIINPRDGGPAWAPMEFLTSSRNDGCQTVSVTVAGYAKQCLGVICPEALGLNYTDEDGNHLGNVLVVHIPTGKHLVTCRHGSRAFQLCDALLAGFPEFGRPFDVAKLQARAPELIEVYRAHGLLK